MIPIEFPCMACGYEHTVNGHLCAVCLRARAGTVHPHWIDPDYRTRMEIENARIATSGQSRAAIRAARAAMRKEIA